MIHFYRLITKRVKSGKISKTITTVDGNHHCTFDRYN